MRHGMGHAVENKKAIQLFFTGVLLSLLLCCQALAADQAGAPSKASTEPQKVRAFELPKPKTDADRAYLGLAKSGDFRVGEIKTQVLLIEFYSYSCAYCQAMAPHMNEIYNMIEKRPDLKDKVKLIGIALGDRGAEVNLFREKFQVVFPLFPDPFMEVGKKMGVSFTPTFMALRMTEPGSIEKVYVHPGPFNDASQFLTEVVKQSGIK
jgi:thiol-disulfide isomerase/thioredoxin